MVVVQASSFDLPSLSFVERCHGKREKRDMASAVGVCGSVLFMKGHLHIAAPSLRPFIKDVFMTGSFLEG